MIRVAAIESTRSRSTAVARILRSRGNLASAMVFREAPTIPCPWCDDASTAGDRRCAACGDDFVLDGFAIGPVTDRGPSWRIHRATRGDVVAIAQIIDGDAASAWRERIDRVIAATAVAPELSRIHAAATRGDRLIVVRDPPLAGDSLADRPHAPRAFVESMLDACLRGLAALHRLDVVHGAIDPGAIRFAATNAWIPTLVVGPDIGPFARRSLGAFSANDFVAPELLVLGAGGATASPSEATDVYALGASLVAARAAKPVAALRRRNSRQLRGLRKMESRAVATLEAMVDQDPVTRAHSAVEALALLETGSLPRPAAAAAKQTKSRSRWDGIGFVIGALAFVALQIILIVHEGC
jgi:hypothetical protein